MDKSDGWCLNTDGLDQDKGSYMVQDPLSEKECLEFCHGYINGRATACEHNDYGACTVHTEPIYKGSGHPGSTCWIFSKGNLHWSALEMYTSF